MTWLAPDGLVAALGVGAAVWWGLGWRGASVLLAFFLSGSVLTHLATGRGARRQARQVLANGGVAAVAALLGDFAVVAGALAAATADTWATEFGTFSPTPPRLITTGTRVSRGVSGGVTLLGSVGGALGALGMAVLSHALAPADGPVGVGTLLLAGVLGMLADSAAGALGQGVHECSACGARFERRDSVCHEPVRRVRGLSWLDNDVVNLIATMVGAAVMLAARGIGSAARAGSGP
ncbi:MAG TPA: DUF92 domain-containing protein [Gemmatimonadales bacterium]|nr:DUF92 domain-containing protein [Gemmatimonadales bacterium]